MLVDPVDTSWSISSLNGTRLFNLIYTIITWTALVENNMLHFLLILYYMNEI